MKTLIGLEIHVELKTERKMFCDCKNTFGDQVNVNVCPVCLGLPGALPVINKQAIYLAAKTGFALKGKVSNYIKMDRKNYFYPDLTKGYQITQDDIPIIQEGYVEIDVDGEKKKIGLIRIHIEEDTGKATHTEDGYTMLDYNRAGVPLIEIVTKPDLSSGKEARKFLEKLREILTELGVSDCKMEEGSMRCDLNINVVDGDKKTKITEVKNIGSTRGVELAANYEEKRHSENLKNNIETVRETRKWDEDKNETVIMRDKTTVLDYRFAQEGDIPPFYLEDEFLEEIKNSLPELPDERKERLKNSYNLADEDVEILGSRKELSLYFENLVSMNNDAKLVSNWVLNEMLRRLNDEEINIEDLKFKIEDFDYLLKRISSKELNNNQAKKVFREMFEMGTKPEEIIKRDNLVQISDDSSILEEVEKVLSENAQSVEDYKNGKDRALGYLVGQVMKKTKGKVNPQKANEMLKKKLDEM